MCLGGGSSLGRRCAVLMLARRGNERTTSVGSRGLRREAERHGDGPIGVYNKSSCFKAGLACLRGTNVRIPGVPHTPAFSLHLIGLRTRDINGLPVCCATYRIGEESSYFEIEREEKPRNPKGGGDATCGGQIYSGLARSGQLYSQGPVRFDKAAAAGPSHLVIRMVRGCSLKLCAQRSAHE